MTRRPRMKRFAPVPIDAVDHQLGALRHAGSPTLKVLLALAIAKGRHGERHRRRSEEFPASLTTVAELAHVGRQTASHGLQDLLQLGVVTTVPSDSAAKPRTWRFAQATPDGRFMPVPYGQLLDTKALQRLRYHTNRVAAALAMYLALLARRDALSGVSKVGYGRLGELGIPRVLVRGGIDTLVQVGLVHVYPGQYVAGKSEGRGTMSSNTYFVLGLGGAPAMGSVSVAEGA